VIVENVAHIYPTPPLSSKRGTDIGASLFFIK
jgi:hypothetical protein